jgi:hypothetical protein
MTFVPASFLQDVNAKLFCQLLALGFMRKLTSADLLCDIPIVTL